MGFGDTPNQADASEGWSIAANDTVNVWKDLCSRLSDLEGLGADAEAVGEVAEGTAAVGFTFWALADLGYALAAFLVIWIVNWTLGKLIDWISDISILGVHPFRWLLAPAAAHAESLNNLMDGVVLRIRDVVVNIFHMLNQTLVRLHNVLDHHQSSLADITNNKVPAAERAAIATAEAYADTELTQLRAQIALGFEEWQNAHTEADASSYIAEANANPDVTNSIVAGFAWSLLGADQHADADLKQAEAYTDTSSAAVAKTAHAELATVESDLVTRLSGDEATLNALTTQVQVTLPAEITQQVHASYEQEQGNLVTATQNLQAEINGLQAQINAVNARIAGDEALIAAAEANITNLQSQQVIDEQAISTQRGLITTAEDDIKTNTAELGTLTTKVTGISQTLATTQAAQQLNTAQLAPYEAVGAPTLALAVAAIAGGLSSLKTEVDTCSVDNCNPSNPNNIENVLKDLLALFTAAAELGFIAEAIKDPVGTANAIAPALDAVSSGAIGVLDGLLSL